MLTQKETATTEPPIPTVCKASLPGRARCAFHGVQWGEGLRGGQKDRPGAPSRTWIGASPAAGPSEAGDADPPGLWGTRDVHRPARGGSWPWPQTHCSTAPLQLSRSAPKVAFGLMCHKSVWQPSIARIRASRGSMRGPPCPLLPEVSPIQMLMSLRGLGNSLNGAGHRPLRPPREAIQ